MPSPEFRGADKIAVVKTRSSTATHIIITTEHHDSLNLIKIQGWPLGDTYIHINPISYGK